MLATRAISATAALLLVSLCSAAIAQTNFYVFGAIGNSDADVSFGGLNRVNDDEISSALGAGYAITKYFSLEGAYHDFGTQNGETDCPRDLTCLVVPLSAQADVTGLSLSLVGNFLLVDRFDVYAKIGLISWDTEFRGISAAFDDSGADLLYGAGVRWSFEDHWKFSAEYARIELDIDTAAIGLSYYF